MEIGYREREEGIKKGESMCAREKEKDDHIRRKAETLDLVTARKEQGINNKVY